jgi:hypothetical protein
VIAPQRCRAGRVARRKLLATPPGIGSRTTSSGSSSSKATPSSSTSSLCTGRRDSRSTRGIGCSRCRIWQRTPGTRRGAGRPHRCSRDSTASCPQAARWITRCSLSSGAADRTSPARSGAPARPTRPPLRRRLNVPEQPQQRGQREELALMGSHAGLIETSGLRSKGSPRRGASRREPHHSADETDPLPARHVRSTRGYQTAAALG